MAENLSIFIPMDRRLAMTRGEILPDRMHGTALFADISGFTPVTEALAMELGAKRGAEELSIRLNQILDAIIAPIHRFGGSVIGFAGDAILCWFDQDNGTRGVAAAFNVQEAMKPFIEIKSPSGSVFSLGIKVAVVSGAVRRFVVGNPEYILMDVMAGKILEDLAAAEGQAERGEIIVDKTTTDSLGDDLTIESWRGDPKTGKRYALISNLNIEVQEIPIPALDTSLDSMGYTESWLLPRVYERLHSGLGTFLAELKPAAAFFLRFMGIDYDNDENALNKLNEVVQRVEQSLQKFDGSCTHLTIGDKGSYFCVVFGAPIGHEDDASRACAAALEIKTELYQLDFIESVQIGITQGKLWAGAYGGSTRRTYDILGDDANLAARLMMVAKPGQILVTNRVKKLAGNTYNWGDMDAIQVKGKVLNIQISQLISTKIYHASKLRTPQFNLPMVGRKKELKLIQEKLDLAHSGKGQIIGITGEAGLGKSRLTAEAIGLANEMQFVGYGGEAFSYGTNTSYLAWHNILRGFFGIDASMSRQEQIQVLENEIKKINPVLLPRLPLLGTALNIPIPENDLTNSLNAKVRKSSLESMLVECIQVRSKSSPILFVLEDCHWLDPLSHDLLEIIGRAIANAAVLILTIYRPPELHHLQAPRVSTLPYFTEINLSEFTSQETDQLIQMKLASSFGPDTQVAPALLERITSHAAGNPFYIEELLNYLHALNIDPMDQGALESLDLPTSITSLILSRVDQLTEHEQTTLKVASVIGRLFPAAMVWGIYPNLGGELKVREVLENLHQLELTVLDTPEPELSYIFKHIFTQEVAYDSLPYATQAMLHETIGEYIEREYVDTLDEYTNILAHHYEHSENEDKKRHYLRKAGESAQKDYANNAAIEYYQKVLPLLPEQEQVNVRLNLGKVLELIGNWEQAGKIYEQVLDQAEVLGDIEGLAWGETAMAELFRKQGRFDEASQRLTKAKELFSQVDNLAGVGQVVHYQGTIADQRGDYGLAWKLMEESLEIRKQIGDKRQSAYLLGNMGIVSRRQGKHEQARNLYEQSLALRREINDRWGVANVLNNLGNLLLDLGDQNGARNCLEEAVSIHQELGDRWATGNALNNLANVLRTKNDYPTARKMYNESLSIYRDLGDKWALAYLFEDIAWLVSLQDDGQRAVKLIAAASLLRDEINAPLTSRETEKLDTAVQPALQSLSSEEIAQAKVDGKSMSIEEAISYAMSSR